MRHDLTPQQIEAIAAADAELSNVNLPTYSDMQTFLTDVIAARHFHMEGYGANDIFEALEDSIKRVNP